MKKFSYGLIIFLILPIIIILSFPNDPISDSTLFTFETENDELLNGTLYLQGLALPILNGEVSVNNSYLYYLDVSDNQLKLKGVISAELEKNDFVCVNLAFLFFISYIMPILPRPIIKTFIFILYNLLIAYKLP